MVINKEKLLVLINVVIFMMLCTWFGIRTWKVYVWAKILPELEEDQRWCSLPNITEEMVLERFGTPNLEMDGTTEGMILKRFGIPSEEKPEGNKTKRSLYVFEKTCGLYGVIGFIFDQNRIARDFTCSFAVENEKLVNKIKTFQSVSKNEKGVQ